MLDVLRNRRTLIPSMGPSCDSVSFLAGHSRVMTPPSGFSLQQEKSKPGVSLFVPLDSQNYNKQNVRSFEVKSIYIVVLD